MARHVVKRAATAECDGPMQSLQVEALGLEINKYCELGDTVVDQAHRRLILNETVPAREKVLSIFQPHTDIIIRGKERKAVEFGHKVFFGETQSGLIADYQILDGSPVDASLLVPAIANHKRVFGRTPSLVAGDQGFSSEANIEACRHEDVEHECLPKRGRKDAARAAYERSPAFKDGQRFRAGIEGRISALQRGRGMSRCRWHGREGFEVFVGGCVLVNNLMKIAEFLTKQSAKKTEEAPAA